MNNIWADAIKKHYSVIADLPLWKIKGNHTQNFLTLLLYCEYLVSLVKGRRGLHCTGFNSLMTSCNKYLANSYVTSKRK